MAGLLKEGKLISRVNFFTFLVASCIVCDCSLFVWFVISLLAPWETIGCPSLLESIADRKVDGGACEVADSGEFEAETSEAEGESKVEFVVVGEESVESENKDGKLPLCSYGFECC